MHELSIILEMVKTVESRISVADGERVVSIKLEIGEMSSAVPRYLKEYFPEAVNDTVLEGADLEIEIVPAMAKCKGCGMEFNFLENRGICPGCGGMELSLVSGREFYIKEIIVDSNSNM